MQARAHIVNTKSQHTHITTKHARQEAEEAREALSSAQRLAEGLQQQLAAARRTSNLTQRQSGEAAQSGDGPSAAVQEAVFWEARCREAEEGAGALRAEAAAARAEGEKRLAAARRGWEEARGALERCG